MPPAINPAIGTFSCFNNQIDCLMELLLRQSNGVWSFVWASWRMINRSSDVIPNLTLVLLLYLFKLLNFKESCGLFENVGWEVVNVDHFECLYGDTFKTESLLHFPQWDLDWFIWEPTQVNIFLISRSKRILLALLAHPIIYCNVLHFVTFKSVLTL